jgi:hypothetical protein
MSWITQQFRPRKLLGRSGPAAGLPVGSHCEDRRFTRSPNTVYLGMNERTISRLGDQGMRGFHKIAVAAALTVMLAGLSGPAAARGRLYPLTQCGPGLSYLCPIHGRFDGAPFHYNLAIRPGCIRTVDVQTPEGLERRRAVVCAAPEREMVWWW